MEQERASVRTVLGIPYFHGRLGDAVALSLPHLEKREPFAVFTPGATVAARAAKAVTNVSAAAIWDWIPLQRS